MAKTLLVADADEQHRNLIKALVPVFGYERVLEAKDGFEALSLLENDMPQVALLDVDLPKLNAYALSEITHFVPRYQSISTALMAKKMDPEYVKKGMEYGVNAFIEKPISAENMKRLLTPASKTTGIPPEATSSMKLALEAFEKAIKQTLTLFFGLDVHWVKTYAPTQEELTRSHDWLGEISLKSVNGDVGGQALFTHQLAQLLCDALGKKTQQPQATGRALTEFLQTIQNKVLEKLSKEGIFETSYPQLTQNAHLKNAKEVYVLQHRLGVQGGILKKLLHFNCFITFEPKAK